jgi:aminoglycoside phosphotransferase (APT) family kinase protein
LRSIFAGELRDASRLRWSFHNEAWDVALADGRHVAAIRLVARSSADAVRARIDAVRPRLLAAGLPVAADVPPWCHARTDVLVTEFLAGELAAERLVKPDGPTTVGAAAGQVLRAFAAADHRGLALSTIWTEPEHVVQQSARWMQAVRADLDRAGRMRILGWIDALPSVASSAAGVLAHGDLAPVNLLLQSNGQLAGVLDLEAACLAHPVFDAVWFDWVLWFHHRRAEPAAWHALCTVAWGGSVPETERLRVILPPLRILEILAQRKGRTAQRRHWLEKLRTTVERNHAV